MSSFVLARLRLCILVPMVTVLSGCGPRDGVIDDDPLHYRIESSPESFVTIIRGLDGSSVRNRADMTLSDVELLCGSDDRRWWVNVAPGESKSFREYHFEEDCKIVAAIFDAQPDLPISTTFSVGPEGRVLGRTIQAEITNLSSSPVTVPTPTLKCGHSQRVEGRWRGQDLGRLTTTEPVTLAPRESRRFTLKSIENNTTGLFPGGVSTWMGVPDPEGEATLVSSLRCQWVYDPNLGPSRKPAPL